MAELESTAPSPASCCSPAVQSSCCEPQAKADCCGQPAAENAACGCAEGAGATADIRETVRARYAEAADALAGLRPAPDAHETLNNRDRSGSEVFGDVLISARRVGPAGKSIGPDMTDEMLDLARRNATEAGLENVEFVKGYLEDLPLADETVDVVISNCVINLSGDKHKVLAEAARILKPGGRFAVSDVIADPDMDEATKSDTAAWTGCIAGALTECEFQRALADAGLERVEIRETHRVHEHAIAAIIRARKPTG